MVSIFSSMTVEIRPGGLASRLASWIIILLFGGGGGGGGGWGGGGLRKEEEGKQLKHFLLEKHTTSIHTYHYSTCYVQWDRKKGEKIILGNTVVMAYLGLILSVWCVWVFLLTERKSSGDEGCPESPSESWPLCGEMVLVWGVAGGLL